MMSNKTLYGISTGMIGMGIVIAVPHGNGIGLGVGVAVFLMSISRKMVS